MIGRSASEINNTVLSHLEEGDLVEFTGLIYSHWAVYIGNGEIIHLTGNKSGSGSKVSCCSLSTSCSNKNGKAHVVKENLLEAAGKCIIKKNNNKDTEFESLPGWQIVQKANEMLGEHEYHLLKSNCEHFAFFLRYGKKISEQAKRVSEYATYTFGGATFCGTLVEFGYLAITEGAGSLVAPAWLGIPGCLVGVVVGFCICMIVRRKRMSGDSKKNN